MKMYYVSIIMVVCSNILYHLFQKSIAPGANPMISLVATYGTALITSIIAFIIYPSGTNFFKAFKELNWASFALGIAIIGLELGFLLAYRAGWNISRVGLYANVIVAVLLIPIGLILFKEHLTVTRSVGIILSIIGIVFISMK